MKRKYTRRGATKEIETGSVEQFGGIIEDEKWDDDVASLLDLSETSEEDNSMDLIDEPEQGKQRDSIDVEPSVDDTDDETSDVDDGTGNWESGQEGWQVYQNSDQDSSSSSDEQAQPKQSAPSEGSSFTRRWIAGWLDDGSMALVWTRVA